MGIDPEIRLSRLLFALTIASLPPIFFFYALTSLSSIRSPFIIPFIVAASWLLLLIGVSLLAAMAAWRRAIHISACYGLGAAVAFLLPLLAVALVIYGAPIAMPETATTYSTVTVPLRACLLSGLLAQPFGWSAGWIVWRMGFPEAAAADSGRFSRYWNDLGRIRLAFSLCLPPLLPIALLLVAITYESTGGYVERLRPGDGLSLAIWAASAALPLATLGGASFLFVGSRGRQGRVSLTSCLTLGGVLATVLPFAGYGSGFLLGIIMPSVAAMMSGLFDGGSFAENLSFLLTMGAVGTTLGLPGGWLLWQIGVSPAPRPLPSDAALSTFD